MPADIMPTMVATSIVQSIYRAGVLKYEEGVARVTADPENLELKE